jgi:hypothetical protein
MLFLEGCRKPVKQSVKVETTVINPTGLPAALPENERSPSGVFSVKTQDILAPPEEFRPLNLKESKQLMKEVFLDGMADLEADAMIQSLIPARTQEKSR